MTAQLVPPMPPAADVPFSVQPPPTERSALGGTLAASMERIARLAAIATEADSAVVALLGVDRRSFHSGSVERPWMSHDSGVVVRTGLLSQAIERGGGLAIGGEHTKDVAPDLHVALRELQIASLAMAVMLRADGTVLGAVLAVSATPRDWTAAQMTSLRDLAEIGCTELQLRHTFAERDLREQKLRHDSLHDALTALPNRAFFLKRLSEATLRARRGVDGMFAVLFLDLDDFKLVNDSMGHHVGDEVLVQVARRLETCLRGGDLVARLGGDEFAILLERVADARETAIVAERIQEAIRTPMVIGGYEWVSSASIGVVLSSAAHEQPEYLLRSADMAMYRAKHNGRGRYELYDRGLHAHALTRLQTETEFRRALERGELEVHYQPVIALPTLEIYGVEALVRWNHPEKGLVLPNYFVSVAEETGLIVPMGRWVLERAIADLREWDALFPDREPLTMAVNLSVREVAQVDLVRHVASALQQHRIAPHRLHVEVTESAILGQQHPAMNTVSELKELGVRIHVDDFGTGYSSLSYLQQLPLDAIKIDRSFVRAIEVESRSRQVVQSLVALARGIGLDAIAEGVSSEGQCAMLASMECAYAQGFFFAKPMPAAELVALVQRGPRWSSVAASA